ncbi:hypothetical protein THRCLA_07493 [Thraustotheca clavata]|uniref:Integrator complex subunit 5 C-terminal domain-containing protein n=1 Tax=Thraustotheca clavata TaxID=74557 RepID=A0A1V9ZD15_9STRA|nr:hypothetical protein THRCLA_07493 [Thraustotheca clavata]
MMVNDAMPQDIHDQFQVAVKKYLQIKAKTKKNRPKKQQRLGSEHVAASTSPQELEAIHRCTWILQEPLNLVPLTCATLLQVLESTLKCLGEADHAVPIKELLGVKDENSPSWTTQHIILNVTKHPVYNILLQIVRKCMTIANCLPDNAKAFSKLIDALTEFVDTHPDRSWLLAFVGSNATSSFLEYSFSLIAKNGLKASQSIFSTLEEFMALEYPVFLVPSLASVFAKATEAEICSLFSVAPKFPVLVSVCDKSLALCGRSTELEKHLASESFTKVLLEFLTVRAEELVNAPVELVLLLEDVKIDSFHKSLLAWLPQNPTFTSRLIESLAHLFQRAQPSDSPTSFRNYFLPYIAQHGSPSDIRDVCQALLPLEDCAKLCGLLFKHLAPESPALGPIVQMLAETMSSPFETQRALQIFHQLAVLDNSSDVVSFKDSIAGQLKAMAEWKDATGVSHWNEVLDQACSDNATTSLAALQLLRDMPYPTLEAPLWQYKCLYRLLSLFFTLLQRNQPQQLKYLKIILARIVREGGGVSVYPASISTTFHCLFVDAILSAKCPTTIPHQVLDEMNFFQSAKDTEEEKKLNSSHVFRKMSAANTLVPYDPFPTIGNEAPKLAPPPSVLSQLQMNRFKWTESSLPAPSTFESTLQALQREKMLQAIECCKHAEELLLAATSASAWSTIVDILLERTLPVNVFIPSDEQYRDILPERSNFDLDIRVEHWLVHYPFFIRILKCVVEHAPNHISLRTLPLLKSILVVLVNHWHTRRHQTLQEPKDEGPPYLHASYELELSLDVMMILEKTQWIPEPLHAIGILFPHLTPLDIRSLLHSVWLYLSDHPPPKQLRDPNNLEYYLIPLQNAIHRNIATIGPLYAQFV